MSNGYIGPGSEACIGVAGKADITLMAEHHTRLPRVHSRALGKQVDKSHSGLSGSLKHLYIKLGLTIEVHLQTPLTSQSRTTEILPNDIFSV